MKDDRMRVTVDDAYALSLGRAVYVFSVLEWNAAWCCNAVRPRYTNAIGKKTVRQIADDLKNFAPRYPDTDRRVDLMNEASEFSRLVDVRNDLMHARASTAPGGAQRLNRHGWIWTPQMIDDAADAFAACSIRLRSFVTT